MALESQDITCQPDSNRETMEEVLDAFFNGIANKYSDRALDKGMAHKIQANKTKVWREYQSEGRWACDVEFMFYADGKTFYVGGTRHIYEISEEQKHEDWGWMDGHNWCCTFKKATKEEYDEDVKIMKKYGDTPYGNCIDNFDYPWDATQEFQKGLSWSGESIRGNWVKEVGNG